MTKRYPKLCVFGSSASRSEAGYSLVEVMVSILLLSVAIIPMVAMFDVGLKSATTSSGYDKARTLASLKLEEAKSLPYDAGDGVRDVIDYFPGAPPDSPHIYNGNGYYKADPVTVTEPAIADDFEGFTYVVEKQFLDQPGTGLGADPAEADMTLTGTNSDEGLTKVKVTVTWGGNKSFVTSGVVSGEVSQ